MSKQILVTGTDFQADQRARLEGAGYEVCLLETQAATEQELIDNLKGKVGFVLRGMERVTDTVVASTDTLKAISFTGADWRSLIPGWEQATKKGIAITNAPGGNAAAVSEFAMAVCLAMQRNLFEIRTSNVPVSAQTLTLKGSTIGIIGAGAIGQKMITQAKSFSPKRVLYYSRTQKDCGAEYMEFAELLATCDIVLVAAPSTAGQLFDVAAIQKIKPGALLVSISPMNLIDFDALFKRLEAGEIRAAIDFPAPDEKYKQLSPKIWFSTNAHSAYNTDQAAEQCSSMAVDSLLNLLQTGDDQYLVNPEYKNSAA
jgi:phosphoglycerate dehydrogenase-like enzyme